MILFCFKKNEPWGKSGLEQNEFQGLTHVLLKTISKAIAYEDRLKNTKGLSGFVQNKC